MRKSSLVLVLVFGCALVLGVEERGSVSGREGVR